ncbi:MAG: C39 family peptidase [Chthoniobacterales bacterium]
MRAFRLIFVTLILVFLLAGIAWMTNWPMKGPISPSGGIYFPKPVVIPVPQFFQGDPRWSEDLLGPTPNTLGAEGCAISSAAMVLASYGADVDPSRLNSFAIENNGYTEQGWLYWEVAALYPPHLAEKAYEDFPSYFLIDWNLLHGNPVIVRLRYPNGITHFVVIVGKSGWDYLIRNPNREGIRGVYPLKDTGLSIEALRFFRKLPARPPAAAISPAPAPQS